MQIHRVTDLTADGLADYSRLTDVALRRVSEPEGGLYIAESTKVITRALAAGHRPRSVLLQEQWLDDVAPLLEPFPDVPVFVGESALLEQLTGYHLHRGALAAMHRPELPDPRELLAGARRVVVLEDIVDHTNVGAIVRCCAAFGVDAVLVTPRCADPLYRRSVRVSMGTIFQVPWTRIDPWPESLNMLNDLGFQTVALALNEGAESLDDLAASLPDRLALILGTEGDGLTARTIDSADRVVYIPMEGGVDSLNVGAASAVALWATRA
ncbi:rRNA methyltransferase [Leifsonia sp. Leaf336]|uniref:TrmH family RNA methyltransferase n=1 Tax=Leifsonia sp. Leaf336 TaxID=1736341 RepID=UPI0006F24584|nr:RNA methyltransferase [Leifsonia sp. Leaf336]KQR54614.1 rRNA methyltransferase [Leifsonia sp. Leaf336]